MATGTTSARRKPFPLGVMIRPARFRCTALCAMSRRRGGARHLLQKQRCVTFDHNAEDPRVTLGNLGCHLTTDLDLRFRFFTAVVMAAVSRCIDIF